MSSHFRPSPYKRYKRFHKPHILVLIGLMGVGKTTLGRALAQFYAIPFIDADSEIEKAAGCSIPEIFERHGESHFREGEHRVLKRLLKNGPAIIATGGGAWMDERTRHLVKETKNCLSLWLQVPLPIILQRVLHSATPRPLLQMEDPQAILKELALKRTPFYAEADLTISFGRESIRHNIYKIHDALLPFLSPHSESHMRTYNMDDSSPENTSSKTGSSPSYHKLSIALAHHSYAVYIGESLLQKSENGQNILLSHLKNANAIIITDENIAPLHLAPLEAHLRAAKIRFHSFIMKAGEQSKSLFCYQQLMEEILTKNIERQTSIIALGGGVVGDLAGFIASTALRGLPFIQLPTTLLAQVDSSVGGKTGINTSSGKNLIGTFWQPHLVLADISTLKTLPLRQIKAGYAEIIKSALIADADLFAWCEENGSKILNGQTEILSEAVKRACAFKAKIVIEDEKEQAAENGRALLNLGHSFAHALEAEYHYDGRLLHGEAVSLGLHLALAFSVKCGFAPQESLKRLDRHLHTVQMPMTIADLPTRPSADNILTHMMKDKKMKGGRLSFILLREIGKAFTTRDIEMDSVKSFLLEEGYAP